MNDLIKSAIDSMNNSYSPYSNFKVGAALKTKDGKIYNGTNIENSSFSATICAERVAIFSAVMCGEKNFDSIAIVGGKNGKIEDFAPPCGICRQVLSEFCSGDFKIILYNGNIEKEFTLSELLPESFTNNNLK